MRIKRAIAVLALLTAFLPLSAEAEVGSLVNSSNTGPAALGPVSWTPILARATDSPRPFRGSDGKYNLVYDVLLTNYNRHDSKLLEFSVLGNGKPIYSLAGEALLKNFMALDGNKDGELSAGTSGVVWVNISFEKKEDIPSELLHKIAFDSTNALDSKETFQYAVAPLTVDQRAPVAVAAPLQGGRWYPFGGYASHSGHRTALFPINNELISAQRFAIDWILLDGKGLTYKSDGKRNEDWFCYGVPVLAVSDGTVYGVLDKFSDQSPFKAVGVDRLSYPAGNCIVLNLDNGYYGVYAHLKPGSIRVKAGDRVKRGQQLGLVGNSGNSDGPHLHFHVVDAPGVLNANGVPYVFEHFDILGEVRDIELSMKNNNEGLPQPVRTSHWDGEHTGELPKEGMLVVFPN